MNDFRTQNSRSNMKLAAIIYSKSVVHYGIVLLITIMLKSHNATAQKGSPPAKNDSLDIKIGQMILFGFDGTKASESSAFYQEIKDGKIGGILIYDRNIATTNTAATLQQMISTYQQVASIPLIISIDQEGGLVNRLKSKYGFPNMPSQAYMGKMNDTALTTSIATKAATAMNKLGINLNYSPVLDVQQAGNPVLGKLDRCFSTKQGVIISQATAVIDGYHTQGLLSVVKHFPGHGRSTTDSHLGITDVSTRWQADELEPYKVLIKAGKLDAIMTAHVVNRQLDNSGLPATLSYKIITGLLRQTLHFNGVVISDDMQMHAISSYYGLKQSIKMAIDAGADILMFSNHIAGAKNTGPAAIFSIIKSMVTSGEIAAARINQSFERIMVLKGKMAVK